jgi:hypothetical protein
MNKEEKKHADLFAFEVPKQWGNNIRVRPYIKKTEKSIWFPNKSFRGEYATPTRSAIESEYSVYVFDRDEAIQRLRTILTRKVEMSRDRLNEAMTSLEKFEEMVCREEQ